MSMEGEKAEQPRSVISHSLDPVERFQRQMGWINFEYMSDHFFIATNAFFDLLGDIEVWLDDLKGLGLPPDPRNGFKIPERLPEQIYDQLKQIWYGHCYLYQQRNKNQEIIKQQVIYNPNFKRSWNENVIELPALMHMNPRSKTKDDTDPRVLIQESIPFDIAYEGYDADQLSQVFGWKWEYADGEVQMFDSDEDIMTSDALVMEISRETFHKLIRILILEFKPRKYSIYNTITKCLQAYRHVMNIKALEGVTSPDDYVVKYER